MDILYDSDIRKGSLELGINIIRLVALMSCVPVLWNGGFNSFQLFPPELEIIKAEFFRAYSSGRVFNSEMSVLI